MSGLRSAGARAMPSNPAGLGCGDNSHAAEEMALCVRESIRLGTCRRELICTIAHKQDRGICFEKDRIAYNAVITQEIAADSRRMFLVMLMRRSTLRDIKFTICG